jgi:hypothetical protein
MEYQEFNKQLALKLFLITENLSKTKKAIKADYYELVEPLVEEIQKDSAAILSIFSQRKQTMEAEKKTHDERQAKMQLERIERAEEKLQSLRKKT